MSHWLRCACGTVRGFVDATEPWNRCICYCKDCQAFAHFLGRPDKILDEQGGTDIVQLLPARVEIATGRDRLACMRLTPSGLVRWYAHCCRTPIGNTLDDPRFSLVGLIHCCLDHGDKPLDAVFGPVRSRVCTRSARCDVAPHAGGVLSGMVRVSSMMLRARLNGIYRRTPFFMTNGAPVASPEILSAEERRRLATVIDASTRRISSPTLH